MIFIISSSLLILPFNTITLVLAERDSNDQTRTQLALFQLLFWAAKEDKLIFAGNLSQGGQKLYSILMYDRVAHVVCTKRYDVYTVTSINRSPKSRPFILLLRKQNPVFFFKKKEIFIGPRIIIKLPHRRIIKSRNGIQP